MMSFICGTEDVATAIREGSVGLMATEEGEKAIQAFECGARFCEPSTSSLIGEAGQWAVSTECRL